jgi:sec-independent protein translocase protein TatA
MNIGAPEIILIVLAILLLFGYKKLPDASRSIGRSLRIFKGEMKGMREDDVRAKDPATTTAPVRGEVVPPVVSPAASSSASSAASSASGDLTAQLEREARAAEARAAELRARAEQARTADGSY